MQSVDSENFTSLNDEFESNHKNPISPIRIKNLIRNETNYTTFSITALSNVRPDNYNVMVIVNSTNASTIVAKGPITFVSTSIFDRLMLKYPILRTFSNPVLQTLIFTTILGGFLGGFITRYFNNKAKDRETYLKSLEVLKDIVFMHYLPMAGYAKKFAKEFESEYESKDKEKIKYSFYLLAVFFSRRSRFHNETGGVLKLQSYKDERCCQEILDEAMKNIIEIIDIDEISKMQKYVPHNTSFIDFKLKLNQEIELINIYDKFYKKICQSGNKNMMIQSFRYYGEFMEYQTTLMFSAWYKREGWKRITVWESKAALTDECKSYIENLRCK